MSEGQFAYMPHSRALPLPVLLVVEDEPLLRIMAVDLGEDAGFVVVEAANAAAAIAILEERTDIGLVFTDIDMPGTMDGIMLAACIRDRWPPIEIIVTCDKMRPSPAQLPARSVFFAKPYRHEQLTHTLRRMAAV